MSVTAIVPVFNRPLELQRAITSIVNQTKAVDEIIIIDDGSSDSTAEVIQQFKNKHPDLIHSFYQKNEGVSAARNLAIQHAKGDWIAFLDSDDEWLENKIETFLEIHQQQDCLLFHSDEIWIRNGVRVNAMKKHQKQGGWIFKNCLPLCVISPSASIIHKSIFDKVGVFDETLPACEDYDLWLRICHQYPVTYSEQLLIKKYGGHEDQLSSKYWGMDRFRIYAIDKLLKNNHLSVENEAAAINMLCKKTKILLKGAHKHNNQSVIDMFTPILEQYD
ncbi:MAG: glycosyltransferase family 2 protein [Gammaproteobacteria bacterium]|nr:glycosyltransferase family 2 protein [Gammaproteobacteria bacterium]